VVMSNYGFESPTFVACRQNWASYLANFPSIPSYFFRETQSTQSNIVESNGYDHLIYVNPNDYPLEPKSSYGRDNKWTVLETQRTWKRFVTQLEFVISNHPDHWVIYVNITAFLSLTALNRILPALPDKGVYAGWPHLLRSDNLLYHSGSGIIYSPDIARLLLTRLNEYSFSGLEAGDIVWGKLLHDIPRSIIPFAQVTPYDTGSSDLVGQLGHACRYLDKGHYLFRIKNTSDTLPRELIDPQLQMYIMLESLRDLESRSRLHLSLTINAHNQVRLGQGITVIG